MKWIFLAYFCVATYEALDAVAQDQIIAQAQVINSVQQRLVKTASIFTATPWLKPSLTVTTTATPTVSPTATPTK